ncbi:transposase [Paraburkholderia humisilvae]|uniref:transposase n=1 Tax=Paraburkholderia humisilvae TaxID=627669 RepID=UPI0035EBEFD2
MVSLNDAHVTFRWENYKHPAAMKTMTLEASEFIRRFLLYVLPERQTHPHLRVAANRHLDHQARYLPLAPQRRGSLTLRLTSADGRCEP